MIWFFPGHLCKNLCSVVYGYIAALLELGKLYAAFDYEWNSKFLLYLSMNQNSRDTWISGQTTDAENSGWMAALILAIIKFDVINV